MDSDEDKQSIISELSMECPHQDDIPTPEHEVNRFQLKNYVNIDSSSRKTQPSLSYQRVVTYDTWLYSKKNILFVVLANPENLPTSSFNSDTRTFGTKKIPNTIIGLIKWFSDRKEDKAPYHIAGVPASQILFNEQTQEPQLTLNLTEYDETEDEAYYKVANITTTEDVALGLDSKAGQAFQFYIVTHRTDYFKGSNHFRVSLEKTYQNVVGINLVSSEIPVPKMIYDSSTLNDNDSRTGLLKIPNRKVAIPFHFTANKYHESMSNALEQGLEAGEVVSLSIPSGDGSPSEPSLFFLETLEKQIKHLSEQFMDIGPNEKYTQGSLIWSHLPSTESNKDYLDRLWIVQKAKEYRLSLEVSTLPFPVSNTYSDVYLYRSDDETLLGVVTQSITNENTNDIIISSEFDDIGNAIIGQTIVISSPKSTATVMEVEPIGESSLIHLQAVSNGPITSDASSLKYGIFLQEEFTIECQDGEPAPGESPEETYLVDGELSPNEDGQTQLRFSNRDMPFEPNGYKIISIEDLQEEERSLDSYPIIGIENTINETVGLQMGVHTPIQRKEWIKLVLPDSSIWAQVISRDHDRLELNLPWKKEYGQSTHIYQENRGIAIRDNEGLQQTTLGILKNRVQDGDYHLDIVGTYPIEKSWLIVIQPLEIGEHRESQLNVVFDTSRDVSDSSKHAQDAAGKLKSLETLVTLRYPLRRDIQQGATIRQTYLFLELYPTEVFQPNKIKVETHIQLHKKLPENCDGCVNWMSNVLLEKNGRTVWATEEPVHIVSVQHLKKNIYELEVDPPLQHHYPWDSYLVIFVDIEMKPCSPSSINYQERGDWYTAIMLDGEIQGDSNFLTGSYRVQGMRGENIPIQGMSRSDEVARQLTENQSKRRGIQEEREWLTRPDTRQDCPATTHIPDRIRDYMDSSETRYMVIEGRFCGRGGRIFPSPKQFSTSFPTRHLTWYHHRSSPLDLTSSVYIQSNKLPRCLQANKDVRIRVKPIQKTDSLSSSPNKSKKHPVFDYFFLCTPYLDRLETVTKPLQLPKTQSSFQFDEPQLQKLGIFAKIQCKPKSGQDKMFNTFVKTDIDLPEIPMEEEIEWIFLWPDGREVNFGEHDVSFTIEIIESHSQLS